MTNKWSPAGIGRLPGGRCRFNSLDLFKSILKSFHKIIESFFYFIIYCKQRLEIYRSSSVQQRFRFFNVEQNEFVFVKHMSMYSYCGIPARSSKDFFIYENPHFHKILLSFKKHTNMYSLWHLIYEYIFVSSCLVSMLIFKFN